MKKISVVMISKNEQEAIRRVVEGIRRCVPDCQILIVDSSDDQTPEIARSLGVEVLRQFPPRGYGYAMDLALRSASGDVVVTMDCDDSYPPERIVPMAEAVLKSECDLVDGSRLAGKPKAMPWFNYIANWGFAMAASVLFCKRLTDLHSGMRAYRRAMIQRISFDASGPALPVELLLKPIRLGYRVKTVFIDYRDRLGQSKMEPLKSACWTFKRILRCRFSRLKLSEKP